MNIRRFLGVDPWDASDVKVILELFLLTGLDLRFAPGTTYKGGLH
jgi:hypothetical protein